MTLESFIPPRSKIVMEVTGDVPADFETTKEKFLEVQPECTYMIAKDISKFGKKLDAIVLQNELIGNMEHDELVELIKKSAGRLAPRGTLIFALDNIAFVENVMAILEGLPPKMKTTLTKTQLEDAIDEAGLNKLRSMNASRRMQIPQELAEISKVNPAVFAFIITATPDEVPPKTLIQTAIGERLVCAPVRIHTPNVFMVTEPNVMAISVDSGNTYELFSKENYENRIFINQRISFPSFRKGADFFREMRKRDYLFLEEMDDNPTLWKDKYEQTAWINFVGAHGVQTSTEYLAEFFRQFNPNVRVFANQLRRILPPRDFDEEFQNSERPVTIFFGALNRDEEFISLLPVLNKFAKEYGNKIAFKIIARQKLFDALESDNKIFVGNPNYYDGQLAPYNQYEEALRTSDIALLPLADNEFNRAKSDLKFIECAGCGAVALASPVVYESTIKDGETGFIFRDERDFAFKLKILIDNREKRRSVAEAAYKYVKRNRLLSQHYEERLDWYRELLARLPELHEETQARIDKIAVNFKDEPPPEIKNESPVEGNLEPNAEIIIPV